MSDMHSIQFLHPPEPESSLARIAQIDSMFEAATGWGSWMVTASNERKGLVNRLREAGHQIDHKYETHAT